MADDNTETVDDGTSTSGPSDTVAREATSMGWKPKDQWKGDPTLWVDADEFVARGKRILPLVRKENERLTSQLEETRRQLADLKKDNSDLASSVRSIVEHQQTEIKRQVKERLDALKVAKADALEEGDFKRAARLDSQIDDLKEAATAPPPPAPKKDDPPKPGFVKEPFLAEFEAENSWLGNDPEKTGLFVGICQKLGKEGKLYGRAMLDEAKDRMDTLLEGKPAQKGSKSEPGSGSHGGTGRSGGRSEKSYASLPAEAKAVCDRQAEKLVGPNRLYKDVAQWQKAFAADYYEALEN